MREFELTLRSANVGIGTFGLAFLVAPSETLADEPPTNNGPGGGEFTIGRRDVKLVDGGGDWTIWGVGQDLEILEK
jgi:hypothetical protein